jgi:hypothetical protein
MVMKIGTSSTHKQQKDAIVALKQGVNSVTEIEITPPRKARAIVA